MNRWAYYNEIDPFAVLWIKEMIKFGLIADGEVDQRSIEDVRADDVAGFRECHFFAGIGIWALVNPELSLWLMGLPDEVLCSGVSAIRLLPRLQRRLLKQ